MNIGQVKVDKCLCGIVTAMIPKGKLKAINRRKGDHAMVKKAKRTSNDLKNISKI